MAAPPSLQFCKRAFPHLMDSLADSSAARAGGVAVVLVPLPAQGHLNQFLLLARRLSRPGISLHYAGIAALNRQARNRANGWALPTTIIFHNLPVRPFVTPPPDPSSSCAFPSHLQPLFDATFDIELPLAALLRSLASSHRRTVVIHDSSLSFITSIAESANAEAFAFNSVSAFASLFYSWEARGNRPQNLEIGSAAGLSFDGCFSDGFVQFLRRQRRQRECSSGHLLNTCRAIEGSVIDLLAQEPGWKDRLNFAIGPLNPFELNRSHHTCMEWLDRQPDNSVVYVSFGTLSSMPDEQVCQLAAGLANSGQQFIWVVRHADRGDISEKQVTIGGPELPEGYEQTVEGRGLVLREWVPQLEILAHRAIGGFLSHCGWNSCMEGMTMGVPMLTWPMHSDQPTNAVLVTEVLRVGLVVRGWSTREELVDAEIVRESIIKLMKEEEGREVRRRAKEVGEAIRLAVTKGGTSTSELSLFIDHITRF